MSSLTAPDDVLNDPSTNGSGLNKHAEYYFTDIIFLVEDQLFKVPRRNFAMESEIFSDMFQLPVPTTAGHSLDGSSDDQPLRLDGIKKSDFAQLLRVMFPLESQPPLLTLEEWTSVLKLSTMWRFNDIRATAIRTMEGIPVDLVDKIIISRKLNISEWLVPSLNALVQREKPVDLLEGDRLGMEWVLKVAELREHYADTKRQLTAPVLCDACNSTSANRCGNCKLRFARAKLMERRNIDYSAKIREVFEIWET